MPLPRIALLLVASVLLLGGCAQPEPLPEGLTSAEVDSYQHEQSELWWNSMFPGEPMPVVEARGYVDPASESSEITDCILAAGLPGLQEHNGSIVQGDMNSTETRASNRLQWECAAAYPYRSDDPEALGLYSDAQLAYLGTYFIDTLAPCLKLMGYRLDAVPTVKFIVDNGPYPQWVPYYVMKPTPETAGEWALVDYRCPPPRIGTFWRPGLDYQF